MTTPPNVKGEVRTPSYPAAFINAIAEEGTKGEAVEWLQKTWDELCLLKELYHLAQQSKLEAQDAAGKLYRENTQLVEDRKMLMKSLTDMISELKGVQITPAQGVILGIARSTIAEIESRP